MTADLYRNAVNEMIENIGQLPNPITLADPHRIRCFQIAYGWCAEAHRLARAIMVLLDQELGP